VGKAAFIPTGAHTAQIVTANVAIILLGGAFTGHVHPQDAAAVVTVVDGVNSVLSIALISKRYKRKPTRGTAGTLPGKVHVHDAPVLAEQIF
jgi:hypothetical protein